MKRSSKSKTKTKAPKMLTAAMLKLAKEKAQENAYLALHDMIPKLDSVTDELVASVEAHIHDEIEGRIRLTDEQRCVLTAEVLSIALGGYEDVALEGIDGEKAEAAE